MPTYGYRCNACGYEFEVFQSITADPLDTCPECSGQIRRIIFPVGIVFKGPGFYVTDNNAKTPKAASPADGDTGSKTQADTAKSESPATDTKQPAADSTSIGNNASTKSDAKAPVKV